MRARDVISARTDLSLSERRCLVTVLQATDDASPRWLSEFRALRSELGPTPCVLYGLLGSLQAVPKSRTKPTPEEMRLATELSRTVPGHPDVAARLVAAFTRLSRYHDAFEASRTEAQRSEHVVHRLRIEGSGVTAMAEARDSSRVAATLERGDSAARADGRPFPRYLWLGLQSSYHPSPDKRRSFENDELTIARSAPSRVFEAHTIFRIYSPMAEAGRMKEVLAAIPPLADWVERNQRYEMTMRLRHLEGRALVRSGQPRPAVVALEKSLSAARLVGNAHFIAEAYHQLTHAHEALADWPRAARVSRLFVSGAQQTSDPGLRVISYNDAATVHWKGGWNAASDSLYRLMVHAIEHEGVHFAFAAAYFERTGRFADAMRYVRRAAQPQADGHVPDRNVVYATLTRLHLALGNIDSAAVTAARHDSISFVSDEALMPRVLMARGEYGEAVQAMRRWTRLQAERGNVRGQINALLLLAEGLVHVAPTRAVDVAREAEALAADQSFVVERATAIRLQGEALTAGDAAAAVAVLARARESSVAHPSVLERILVDVALGRALERSGVPERALASYASAVRSIESLGESATDDVMRARFRAARAAAFDGALRVVYQTTDSGRADQLLHWSERKKRVPGAVTARVSLTDMRRKLPPGHAVIDFVVIDSTIVAIVATRTVHATVTLPLSAADVRRLSQNIVRPFSAVHGGRVDLARAPFDSSSSRALYAGLVAPLLPHLGGAGSITIVPDTPIHSVPFDALLMPGPSAEFLIDRFAIRYALSHGTPNGAHVAADAPLMLLVGDAPGAGAERDYIRRSWSGTVTVLEGARASETRVAAQTGRGSILHVASHARSDDRDPLSSYLTLARDSLNDGMLHYAEIERLGARHALVMLNACETSAGVLLAGSGFMSLARAFLVSGSTAVVATQWPVGAVSATLANRFYRGLRAGLRADAALREAKLAVRRESTTSHPFYWASHQLLLRH